MSEMIAYRDEYPWIRCGCGYLLNADPGICPGCGITKVEPDRRDRFSRKPSVDVKGNEYRPVPYEDCYRYVFRQRR